MIEAKSGGTQLTRAKVVFRRKYKVKDEAKSGLCCVLSIQIL